MKRRCSGFTLIEILVVVTIVAIVVATVVLGFTGADSEKRLEGEAYQFVQRFELARTFSLQRNAEWGVYVEPDGYEFAEFDVDAGSWLRWSDRPLQRVGVDESMSLRVKHDEVELPNAGEEDLPDLVIFSSGEVTPFSLYVEPDWETRAWIISSDGIGRAEVRRDDVR